MNTSPATPSPTCHHGRTPTIRRKGYNHRIALPTRDLLVQVTVKALGHSAKRSHRNSWFRKQLKKLKNRSRTKAKVQKDELKAVRAEVQNLKDAMDELSSWRNKFTRRIHKLKLQNELLKQEFEVDEGSDGFQETEEPERQDRQFSSDNDHEFRSHYIADEKAGPLTRLVTPSPPPPPEIPKAPRYSRFTDKCSSRGPASINTYPDSSNDSLNTALPSGIGLREAEREKKGAQPAKSSNTG